MARRSPLFVTNVNELGFTQRITYAIVFQTVRRDRNQGSFPVNRPNLGGFVFFALAFALSAYFTFAAVQGNYGLFSRVEITAERDALTRDLAALKAEIATMENLTLRLSDGFLDLDLLDERAREVLGLLRADEIVIR
ncbi:MAG: septum formation initiator [Pseudooceanicola sp.]|jgi:cell division protein FtsB|nr:septum formation initiator [Pseudooceanicola sp.]|tara:strand:- start:310 stop:720 length:411 start_codon:yes stop_codon:yes gene_type:complete